MTLRRFADHRPFCSPRSAVVPPPAFPVGAVTVTFGSATVIACAQMLLCRIDSSGPGLPSDGYTKGPRGDTMHALINVVGVIPKTPVFDSASWAAELTWSQWTKVRSGENLFNAVRYAP